MLHMKLRRTCTLLLHEAAYRCQLYTLDSWYLSSLPLPPAGIMRPFFSDIYYKNLVDLLAVNSQKPPTPGLFNSQTGPREPPAIHQSWGQWSGCVLLSVMHLRRAVDSPPFLWNQKPDVLFCFSNYVF